MSDVYVQARDGALYLNPTVIFPEGFLWFGAERPELVLWLVDSVPTDVQGIFDRVFGPNSGSPFHELPKVSQRVVPLTDPWQYRPAVAFPLRLLRRIPRPKKHDGAVRYVRDPAARVLKWGPHARDLDELDVLK